MVQLSCSNCWFNGLQYGPVGLQVGYCTELQKVLPRADETTCGRQRRKDLLWPSASKARVQHRKTYPGNQVVSLSRARGEEPDEDASAEDLEILQSDSVGNDVTEYGELQSKIESLARLSRLPGVRAEIAMLSLARGYVARCVDLDGSWTSGLHLLWWTRRRLADIPDIELGDLRLAPATSLQRQVELVRWSLGMLRLTFLSDIGHHAAANGGHDVRHLADLPEEAALAAGTNPERLFRWIHRTGNKAFDKLLPRDEYRRLGTLLHRAPKDGDADSSSS